MSKLEQQLADCESALVEETVVSQERKLQLERAQYQVAYISSFIYKNTRFKEQMAQHVKMRIRIWIWIQVMTLWSVQISRSQVKKKEVI